MKKKKPFVSGSLSLCTIAFLMGCNRTLLFDPKGPIADAERFVILASFGLMLIVVIPVFVLLIWFSVKYRASNAKANYMPKWSRSNKIELTMWLVPAVIVAILATLTWTFTHRLDPFKPIAGAGKPINIEAVSLDWKWLFIYPDQNIAVVNQLAFPARVPLNFRITSDTVLASFFIPRLGSQVYAMPGKQTQLHLLADERGTYAGQNQQFSGRGYADMHFQALATSRDQFQAWVQKARQSPNKLDSARYEALKKPTAGYPVTYFSSVMPGLFDHIISKYRVRGAEYNAMRQEDTSGSDHTKIAVLEGH